MLGSSVFERKFLLCSNNANINFTLKPLANLDIKFEISPSVFLRLSQLLPIQCISKGL